MLKSISGENDQTSSSSANRPNAPKIAAINRFTGNARYSPCFTAGRAIATAPTMAHAGPSNSPITETASNDKSAARKFGTRTRIQTPSISGTQIHAISRNVLPRDRSRISNNRLKWLDRASELATAAATPSSTSSVIQISFGSVECTPLLYAVAPNPASTNLTNSRE